MSAKGISQMRIMVIDDDQFLLRAYTRALGSQVIITSTRTLSEARVFLTYHTVDLVLLDKGLPDGTGAEFAVWLKNEYPATRVVMMTAGEHDGFDELVQQGVAETWLKKPLPLSTLRDLAVLDQPAPH